MSRALADFVPPPPQTYAETCEACGIEGSTHPDEHLCPACVAERNAYLDERYPRSAMMAAVERRLAVGAVVWLAALGGSLALLVHVGGR